MSDPIVVKHSDQSVIDERHTSASEVLGQFPRLPRAWPLIFLDDVDDPFFRMKRGETNRGFFVPSLSGDKLMGIEMPLTRWPDYIIKHVYSQKMKEFLCDQVVYICGSACAEPVGRVMTLAHELQHFVQYDLRRDIYEQNFGFCGKLPNFEIPIEREARIVSKRIAMRICGSAMVEQYIAQRIDDAERHVKSGCGPNQCSLSPKEIKDWKDEVDDWRFVKHLDISIPYDLEAETIQLHHNLAAC